MGKWTYAKLINQALEMYLDEDYAAAYDFLTEKSVGVEGNAAQIYNFRYTLASKAGNDQLAIKIMMEAIIEKELWYAYDYLMADEDLDALREFPEFKEMAEQCKERETVAKQKAEPLLNVIKPKEGSDLLIALHGNEENIALTEPYWRSALDDQFILALPQSSDIQFSDGYMWEDAEKGAKELKAHYNHLAKTVCNNGSVVLGGFSAGARTALYALLTGMVEADGFIFVGPWLPEINEWEPMLNRLKEKDVKGYIIYGDQDEDCKEGAMALVEMLNKKGIKNQCNVYPGLNHEYPDHFEKDLHSALKFITKK